MSSGAQRGRLAALGTQLQGYVQLGLHRALAHAPIDLASELSKVAVRRTLERNHPGIIANARLNLSRLRPEALPEEIEAGVKRFVENVGRLYGEYSVLHRLIGEGRVSFDAASIRATLTTGAPVVVIMLHTGNWEVFAACVSHLDLPVAAFFLPPGPQVHDSIVRKVRGQFGITLLEPGAQGVRQAVRILRGGGPIVIFGDDARGGRSMAPLFGAPPHDGGNLALVARFARTHKAKVAVFYCVRHRKSRFSLHAIAPFSLPDAEGARASLLDDVAYLNGVIEPIVRAHADQWYFLDPAIGALLLEPREAAANGGDAAKSRRTAPSRGA